MGDTNYRENPGFVGSTSHAMPKEAVGRNDPWQVKVDPAGMRMPLVLNEPIQKSIAKDDVDLPQKFKNYISKFDAVYSFTGHGSKNQLKDISEISENLEDLVNDLNKMHGAGKWLAVYGGDPYNPEKPDIGFIMEHLFRKHKIKILAVQCRDYVVSNAIFDEDDYATRTSTSETKKEEKARKTKLYEPIKYSIVYQRRSGNQTCWVQKPYYTPPEGISKKAMKNDMGCFEYYHWDAVIHYETDRCAKTNDILYAGYDCDYLCFDKMDDVLKNHLVGTSRYIFGQSTPGLFQGLLKGVVSCGGGPIALKETELAMYALQLPVLYIRTKVRYAAPAFMLQKPKKADPNSVSLHVSTKGYGIFERFMMNQGFGTCAVGYSRPKTAEDVEDEQEKAEQQRKANKKEKKNNSHNTKDPQLRPWGWIKINHKEPKAKKAPRSSVILELQGSSTESSQTEPLTKEEIAEEKKLCADTGLKYLPRAPEHMYASKNLNIPVRVFERPLDRDEYGIAVSIMKLWDIKDHENSFRCTFFMQLVCLGDTKEKRRNPTEPWFEVMNELTAMKPTFEEAWNKAKESHKKKCSKLEAQWIADGKRKEDFIPPRLEIKQNFEGTFLLVERDLKMFPYDFQRFYIRFRFGNAASCRFVPLRDQAALMKPEGMDAVENWAAAKTTIEVREEDKRFMSGLLYLLLFLFGPLWEYLTSIPYILWWFFCCCCPNRVKRRRKLQQHELKKNPYWMEPLFTTTDPADSASGEVYRELKMTLLMRRVSNYVSMNFQLPSLLLGTSGILQFWIHPIEMAGERLAFTITLTLSIIALKFNVQQYVPPLARQTYVDMHTLATILFVTFLAFINILAFRWCLPLCDAELCDKDYSRYDIIDYRRYNNTNGDFCECHCDADDYLLFTSEAVWFVIQFGFWRMFLEQRFRFDKLLHRHGLVCGGTD